MTKLVIQWPDEAGEAVRAARGRLAIAFDALNRISFTDRLERVSAILDAWTHIDSPWRRELVEQLDAETPFHRATLTEGLESAFAAWNRDAFVTCACSELAMPNERRRLAPFESVSVLAGGVIPMPTLLQALLPLVLGSPVLLRETSRDSVTGSLLARCMVERDPELARALEVVRFPSEDREALDAFLDSPCVVATGSDEMLASLRTQLRPQVRLVEYGHRFSIALFGPTSFHDGAEADRAIAALALDIARWDQLGCLSPVEVYLVGLEPAARIEFAERLAEALGERSVSLPRGEYGVEELALHAAERGEARMRSAVADDARCLEGADWTVALEADAAPRVVPLLRFIRLKPVSSMAQLNQVLGPVAGSISTAACFGFGLRAGQSVDSDGDSESKRATLPGDPQASTKADADSDTPGTLLTRIGVSRICEPGMMQTPPVDWPHDGLPLFVPMARFSE